MSHSDVLRVSENALGGTSAQCGRFAGEGLEAMRWQAF